MLTETGKATLRAAAVFGVIVVLLVLAVGGYLFKGTRLHRTMAGPLEKVTIAHTTIPYAALAQIAQMRDFYRQEGLDAEPKLFSYGKLALEAVLAGKADFATAAETPIMLAVMKGARLSILATIHVSTRSHAIVARKDRGIAAFGDLKGKLIGTTLGTSADFYLDSFLLSRGILRKDIGVVDLKPEEIPGAFAAGDVDAVSTWAPYLMQAQKVAGPSGITFLDDDIYTLTFNVVTTREFAERNPEKVKKVLRALLQAEEFAKSDLSEAQRLVAQFNKMDFTNVAEWWNLGAFEVTLDQTLLLVLEEESRWAIKSGLTQSRKMPNYLDYIYLDGLQSVKPGRAGIHR